MGPAGRNGIVRNPALPTPLGAGLIGLVHAVVAAAAVAGCLLLVQSGRGPSGRGADTLPTQLVQASGIVALIWAYAGLLLGLLIGIRPIGIRPVAVRRVGTRSVGTRPIGTRPIPAQRRPTARVGRSMVLDLHQQLNIVVLALVLLHALVFALGMAGGSMLVAFVPGIPGPQSLGYTLGVLALYLAALLGPSYYLRDRIGRRTWLIAHQFAALSYAVALWHSLALGSDVRLAGVGRTLTWALQIPLLVLIVLRLFRPRRPADQLSPVLRRGRYGGPRNTRLRAAIALGLVTSGVLILLMALLAGSIGEHVSG